MNTNRDNVNSLYIHIPYCNGKCAYCGFYSVDIKNHDPQKLLAAEIAELKKYVLQKLPETIYIGGGSPSCLGSRKLCGFLGEIISIAGEAREFSVEVNPGQVDLDFLKALRTLGVNRLSVGAQSFCDEELKLLGRGHSAEGIYTAIDSAKKAGFDNISIDLIFALPGQSINSWKRTLQKAIACDVQHISAYALSYEKDTPFEKMNISGKITPVDEATDAAMYEFAIDELTSAGFEHYEISNFAKAGFQCRHNLAYWLDENYIGIGPAAGSHIANKRIMNLSDIEKYIQTTEKEIITLTDEQSACEKMVLGLRKIAGVGLEEFKSQTGFDAENLFAEAIEQNIGADLLIIENGRLKLTAKALPIADSVLCDFAGID